MHTLFVSDLHLSHDTPKIAQNFLALLHEQKSQIEALYILGDLFEYWLGDDGITPAHSPIIGAIKAISDAEIPVYFMHGNRDFLIGETFANQCGAHILPENTVIQLYGEPVLLTHGDLLCTDDTEYMAFREQVRNPAWQTHFLSLPMDQRIEMAKQARDVSQHSTKEKSMEIMDANLASVKNTMNSHSVNKMIHGHTHRPAIHDFKLGDNQAHRIVLGDWKEKASFLTVSKTGYHLSDPRWTS